MEEKIQELIKKFKEYKADGKLGALDIFKFIVDCISEFVVTAEDLKGKTGAEKKMMVLTALENLYNISGLDIPYVPNFLEKMILFRYILPAIIDTIVALLNKKGIFTHNQEIPCKSCTLN